MNVGSVVRMRSIKDYRPDGITMTWKAPQGREYVAVIIGTEPARNDRPEDEYVDTRAALLQLAREVDAESAEVDGR